MTAARGRLGFTLLLIVIGILADRCGALEPSEILIVANETNRASTRIAEYYCDKRGLSRDQILRLPLAQPLASTIDRAQYLRTIAEPVRQELNKPSRIGRVRCLLTIYGIPYRIGPAGAANDPAAAAIVGELGRIRQNRGEYLVQIANRLENPELKMTPVDPQKIPRVEDLLPKFPERFEASLKQIQSVFDPQTRRSRLEEWVKLYIEVFGKPAGWKKSAELGIEPTVPASEQLAIQEDIHRLQTARDENWSPARRFEARLYTAFERVAGTTGMIAAIDSDTDNLRGKETGAALDSELTMVRLDDYPLYRWQPNELKQSKDWAAAKTLMVSRLDGPDETIVLGLIDKALAAEKVGLQGVAYFDGRYPNPDNTSQFGQYDRSIHAAAELVRRKTTMKVVEDSKPELFAVGSCPDAALYCGWYSLRKYVDAFDFVPGAVGYHIASFEASDLRGATSLEWCPAMLRDGITATLGPVDEPYLSAFPLPEEFFGELIGGRCLVEAYFRTNPFNSWQMLLIGDPLYRPFVPGKGVLAPNESPLR
jgi:uncharacterized protein (TIGR03790 family)